MLGFRKLFAEVLVCNSYYKEEEDLPRRLSRLTKNAEHMQQDVEICSSGCRQPLYM